jgi:hypothetical protein
MRWIKCNHRHALSRNYDYFWQSPTRSMVWQSFGNARKLIEALREHHGNEVVDTADIGKFRNPKWWLDRSRRRIWVKAETLVMLQLRGFG